jgi:hypothetical protein
MSIIKGLKNISEAIDKPKGSAPSGPRVRWLKLEDGQSVKVRFANEVDDSSKFYDEDRGLAIVVSEHTNPTDYKRKAVCTMDDEGRCFGCDMHRRNPKDGWKPRLRFYTNVLVDDGMEDPYVAVWSMGVAKSATFNTIREFAADGNSVSNMTWKVKRNGKGTETNYILIPGATDSDAFDWSGYDVFPLESAIRQVPFADQESFYLGFDNPATSTSVDW